MFVLPQLLLLGAGIIERTSFSVPSVIAKKNVSGRIVVDAVVSGEIHGTVSGIVRGTIDGNANLSVISGSMREEESDAAEQK